MKMRWAVEKAKINFHLQSFYENNWSSLDKASDDINYTISEGFRLLPDNA